ncbi:hypothetical protein [Streptomyces mirabilis]
MTSAGIVAVLTLLKALSATVLREPAAVRAIPSPVLCVLAGGHPR